MLITIRYTSRNRLYKFQRELQKLLQAIQVETSYTNFNKGSRGWGPVSVFALSRRISLRCPGNNVLRNSGASTKAFKANRTITIDCNLYQQRHAQHCRAIATNSQVYVKIPYLAGKRCHTLLGKMFYTSFKFRFFLWEN